MHQHKWIEEAVKDKNFVVTFGYYRRCKCGLLELVKGNYLK
jgi:hypothetical protein